MPVKEPGMNRGGGVNSDTQQGECEGGKNAPDASGEASGAVGGWRKEYVGDFGAAKGDGLAPLPMWVGRPLPWLK